MLIDCRDHVSPEAYPHKRPELIRVVKATFSQYDRGAATATAVSMELSLEIPAAVPCLQLGVSQLQQTKSVALGVKENKIYRPPQ